MMLPAFWVWLQRKPDGFFAWTFSPTVVNNGSVLCRTSPVSAPAITNKESRMKMCAT
jgi:hypothetical protein